MAFLLFHCWLVCWVVGLLVGWLVGWLVVSLSEKKCTAKEQITGVWGENSCIDLYKQSSHQFCLAETKRDISAVEFYWDEN